jgi:flagellum-specific peptidoglycan hydrolase FlgJ
MPWFETPDVIAAIQNVMTKRFKQLTENGKMTKKDAYFRVYKEFERGLTEAMKQQARLIYLEETKNGSRTPD